MTEQNLLTWAQDRYFSDWEIERAKKVLDKSGMAEAVEYLRKEATSSCRGMSGPDQPRIDTRAGKILLWSPVDHYGREADIEYDIAWFCRRKMESLFQISMF